MVNLFGDVLERVFSHVKSITEPFRVVNPLTNGEAGQLVQPGIVIGGRERKGREDGRKQARKRKTKRLMVSKGSQIEDEDEDEQD